MQQKLRDTFSRNRLFMTASLGVLLAGLLLSLVLGKYDANAWLAGFHGPFLNAFFKTVTMAGEPLAFLLALTAFLFIRFRYAVSIPVLLILSSSIGGILKRAFQHPRPYTWLQSNGNIDAFPFVEGVFVNDGLTSFPSGHSLTGFALFTFLALSSKSVFLQMTCLFIAVCIAVSRVYMGQHFLQDVVFGSALGWSMGIVVFAIQDQYLAGREKWNRALWRKRAYTRSA